MQTPTMSPANQKKRIAALRFVFLLILPLIVLAKPMMVEDTLGLEAMEAVGGFLIIGAVLGRFWCILYIGGRKNTEVVQIGPYSICRHPLYMFSTMGVLGFGLALGMLSLAVGLGALVFLILMYTAQHEEAFLRTEFGSTYDNYALNTPLIIPRISQFYSPNEVTFNVHTLRRNMFDAMVFLAFFPAIEIIETLKDAELFPVLQIF